MSDTTGGRPNQHNHYAVIVVGLGGMGAAALDHTARRGHRVLGLDAHPAGHTLGSSHGQSRIIRKAYFEAPDYVPLLLRAYTLWAELAERESAPDLLQLTGGLMIGAPDSEVVTGSMLSARTHGLAAEHLSAAEVNRRFPQFALPDTLAAVYEPDAGVLHPERGIAAHLASARRHGAAVHHAEPVTGWSADDTGGVRVTTATATYHADRLILTPGPWAGELLADLDLPLHNERVVAAHFDPQPPERFTPDRCPIYVIEVPEGTYYGFPLLPDQGVKVGNHIGTPTTPATIRRDIEVAEIEQIRSMFNRYAPGGAHSFRRAVTCIYTNTPDYHFIVDRHPRHPNVALGCGFCGHGYKFASVIGEVLADLALEGHTDHPIGFLGLDRFRRAASG